MSRSEDRISNRLVRYVDWRSAYDDVLRETDTFKLFKLVEIAEAAILTRRDALARGPNHYAERQAIEDGLTRLKLLKRTRLNFDRR